MRFTADTIPLLRLELERVFDDLTNPQSPTPVFVCLEADLPSAASWTNHVLRVSDLNILAVSDGSNWIRQDTGAAI